MERPDEPLCSGEREEESKASCAFIKNVIKKVKAGRVGPRFEKDERWHFPPGEATAALQEVWGQRGGCGMAPGHCSRCYRTSREHVCCQSPGPWSRAKRGISKGWVFKGLFSLFLPP